MGPKILRSPRLPDDADDSGLGTPLGAARV